MRTKIYLDRFMISPGVSDTEVIQEALDQCRLEGGEVILSSGSWLISSIRLYSDTTLRLKSGCHLAGSTDSSLYRDWGFESSLARLRSGELSGIWQLPPDFEKAMITAVDAENVAVIGELGSTVDGQNCQYPFSVEGCRGPMGMVFCRCSGITLRGYTFIRCGNWTHLMDSCRDILLDNVQIRGGHDGVDLHCSSNIRVENCDFRTGDDCLAGCGNQNLFLRSSYFNSPCSCFCMGAANVIFESCRFWGPGEYPHRDSGRHNTLSAFQYYSPESGPQIPPAGWVISDCVFEDLDRLLDLDYGGAPAQLGSPLKKITFQDCTLRNIQDGARIRSTVPMAVEASHLRVSFKDGTPKSGFCDTTPQVTYHIRDLHIQAP